MHKHTDNPWVKLYINRWLTAPMQMPNGEQVARGLGTPQGGVAAANVLVGRLVSEAVTFTGTTCAAAL